MKLNQIGSAYKEYTPQYEQSNITVGYGWTAICLGWAGESVKEQFIKKVDNNLYAAVGSLYSAKRGIEFLLRNLLCNPHVSHVVLLTATTKDTNAHNECLEDFFNNGFVKGVNDLNKDCWVIKSQHLVGYIDIAIAEEALEDLRKHVTFKRVYSIDELYDHVLNNLPEYKEPVYKARTYVVTESYSDVLPSAIEGQTVYGNNIAEAWLKTIHRVRTNGIVRESSYTAKWQELISLSVVVNNEPSELYFPEPNYLPVTREDVNKYIPQLLNAQSGDLTDYSYGTLLRSTFGVDQIQNTVDSIVFNPNSSRVVMSLWHPHDYSKANPPCLNHIWLRVVNNELLLTAVFRSNDMYGAWVSNAMALVKLHDYIVEEVNKRVVKPFRRGSLTTTSQSAHIYEYDWEEADSKAEAYRSLYIKEHKKYNDRCGDFTVEVLDRKMKVKQLSPGGGVELRSWTGRNIEELLTNIISNNPTIDPHHAAYLGCELEKAWTAWRNNEAYKQDY